MAALTPTSKEYLSMGNRYGVLGTFSAAADTDTWDPGLATIEAAFITNGANDVAIGATYSGTTVVVQTAGALANVKILAIGV